MVAKIPVAIYILYISSSRFRVKCFPSHYHFSTKIVLDEDHDNHRRQFSFEEFRGKKYFLRVHCSGLASAELNLVLKSSDFAFSCSNVESFIYRTTIISSHYYRIRSPPPVPPPKPQTPSQSRPQSPVVKVGNSLSPCSSTLELISLS